jgi:F-type H+-transporting ATPase subunit a
MASPILHIKDAYYFEVPKKLWRHHYESLDEVPKFLREGHPEVRDPKEFADALHGKILIPQPFGELKNLYEPASGFCISKFMILTAVAAIIVTLIFVKLAKKVQTGDRPRGKFWNLFEAMLLFVRDDVARPAIGKHDADKYVPLLWTLFFFVLGCNLLGLVPWAGAPTAAFAVTLSLAAVTLLTGMVSGIIKFGPVGYVMNQIPHMDLPWYMAILLKPMIWVIEVLGMLIKHGVLGVRLLANMVAGHVVLLGIMTLAFSVEGVVGGYWGITAPIAVVSSTLFTVLELFVAFLQAYVFTFLSALFIGAAIHHH